MMGVSIDTPAQVGKLTQIKFTRASAHETGIMTAGVYATDR